jgi:hypothetical protein
MKPAIRSKIQTEKSQLNDQKGLEIIEYGKGHLIYGNIKPYIGDLATVNCKYGENYTVDGKKTVGMFCMNRNYESAKAIVNDVNNSIGYTRKSISEDDTSKGTKTVKEIKNVRKPKKFENRMKLPIQKYGAVMISTMTEVDFFQYMLMNNMDEPEHFLDLRYAVILHICKTGKTTQNFADFVLDNNIFRLMVTDDNYQLAVTLLECGVPLTPGANRLALEIVATIYLLTESVPAIYPSDADIRLVKVLEPRLVGFVESLNGETNDNSSSDEDALYIKTRK